MSKFFKKLFGRNKKDKSAGSVAGSQHPSASSGAASKSTTTSTSTSGAASKSATAPAAGATGAAASGANSTDPSSATGATGAAAATDGTAAPGVAEATTPAGAATGTGATGTTGAVAGGAAGAGAGAAAGSAGTSEKVATKTGTNPAKIAIIGHSLWGHVDALIKAAAEGVKSTGATVEIFSFGETLPPEVLAKMHASKQQPYPAITPDQLKEFDGYLLAAGTRFGRLPAQVDTFFDQTGGLWATGALLGKFAGLLTSTGSQHGGQETTFVTTLPWLSHHGINYVPIGYQFEQLNETDVVQGAAPWGATTLSKADGSRAVNSDEKVVAEKQGAYFATVVGTFKKGATA